MKKLLKIIVLILVVLGVLVGTIYLAPTLKLNNTAKKHPLTAETYTTQNGDRLHFLNTGSSDCILIESNGQFGLVDGAEDSTFPADRPNLNYNGFEKEVVAYIHKVAGDQSGKVTLDFILGTHSHSDHIGGFDTIISDPTITIKKAYLKEYHAQSISKKETEDWDNQEVYDQMVAALKERNVPLIQDLEAIEFALGDFNIKLLNGQTDFESTNLGENENSVITLIQKGDKKALLAGDVNNIDKDEAKFAPVIGDVDLLKVGHHGYIQSSSYNWLKTLKPEIAVVTNYKKKMTPDVLVKLAFVSGSALFCTADQAGVIATFTDDGQINMTNHIM